MSKTCLKELFGKSGYAKTVKKTTPGGWPAQNVGRASARKPSDSLGNLWPRTIRKWHLKSNLNLAMIYQCFKNVSFSVWPDAACEFMWAANVSLTIMNKGNETRNTKLNSVKGGGKRAPSCLMVLPSKTDKQTGPSLVNGLLDLVCTSDWTYFRFSIFVYLHSHYVSLLAVLLVIKNARIRMKHMNIWHTNDGVGREYGSFARTKLEYVYAGSYTFLCGIPY